MLAVEVRDLVKTFRNGWFPRRVTHALRGVSLSVPRGVIFGLLGPNGAGKTTLLSILATLLLPDGGQASVLGHDVVREAGAVRRRINLASGNSSFLWSLTVREILDIYARLYGLPQRERGKKVEALLDLCEIRPYASVIYNELSTGLKQRLALAKALVNDPELLFLDEPTVGLDPDISIRIRQQVTDLRNRKGVTILLTTHYMREAEELCDEIAFIWGGQILARGDAESLKRQIKLGDTITVSLDHPDGDRQLMGLPGVLYCRVSGNAVECLVDDARKRLPDVLRCLQEGGSVINDVLVSEPDLEKVFIELVREGERRDVAR
jgi:ABC-2 type transport system ATP-binding protein